MFKKLLIATLVGSLAFSIAGCPPTNGSNNSNSSQNENAGGDANENANTPAGNENTNNGGSTNENANTAANANANGGGNENANTAANSNDNSTGGNTNTNSGSGLPITGNYTGTLAGTTVITVINLGQPTSRDRSFASTIAFDGSFVPASLPIALYNSNATTTSGIVQLLTNVAAGQSQLFNYSHPSDGAVTLTATVQSASYGLDSAHVVVNFQYASVSGNLTESGTGTQTFDANVDTSGNIVVSISANYAVRLAAGSLVFDTTDVIGYTGTLPKQ